MKHNKIVRIMLIFLGTLLAFAAAIALAAVIFINTPAFGRTPRGERLERIRRSANYRDGQFRNIHPAPLLAGGVSRLSVMARFFTDRNDGLRPDRAVEAVKTDLAAIDPGEDLLIWFGHSSYLIQSAGRRALVDPVFCAAAPVGFLNKAFEGTEIYTPDDIPAIDYLVITHDHWDHLDYRTVRSIRDRVRWVVCPLGVGEHFERWGFEPERLIELDWHESAEPDSGVMFHCLPARHFSGRGLNPNQTLWASFLWQTPARQIYIGGDGGYDTHFAETGARFPGIDLALLENGQYNTAWPYTHTLPAHLHAAARDVGARSVMTVHHSKYALSMHRWDEPLRNAEALAADSTLHVLRPVIGEVVLLGGT